MTLLEEVPSSLTEYCYKQQICFYQGNSRPKVCETSRNMTEMLNRSFIPGYHSFQTSVDSKICINSETRSSVSMRENIHRREFMGSNLETFEQIPLTQIVLLFTAQSLRQSSKFKKRTAYLTNPLNLIFTFESGADHTLHPCVDWPISFVIFKTVFKNCSEELKS